MWNLSAQKSAKFTLLCNLDSEHSSKIWLLQFTIAASVTENRNPHSYVHQTLSVTAAGKGIILLFQKDIYSRARSNTLSQTRRAGH